MVELELITLSIITTLELEPLFSRLALIGEKNLPQFYAKYSNWRFTGSVFSVPKPHIIRQTPHDFLERFQSEKMITMH